MVRWLAVAAFLTGCEGLLPQQGDTEPTCDLTFDNLNDRTFVAVEAMPDGTDARSPIARVKFVEEEGKTVAKYTAASLSDVYDLPCTVKETDDSSTLFCAEEARPTDWCQALLVADEICSKKVLRKFGVEMEDDELNEAIKKAKENWRKFRDTEYERQFVLNNNNLGNKLQGRLYVDVDEKRCQLSVGDYYWTIFNGRGQEDTNPVGQNPFVEVEEQYLFEHCTEGNIMPGIETEELPKDLSSIPGRGRRYENGKTYWYHYLGENHTKAVEGCTYSFDVWANFKKVSEGNPIEPARGELAWKVQHSFTDGVGMWGPIKKPVGVLTMLRYKQCDGGAKEKLDVVCEAGLVE